MSLFDRAIPWFGMGETQPPYRYWTTFLVFTDADVDDCIERMELRLMGIDTN